MGISACLSHWRMTERKRGMEQPLAQDVEHGSDEAGIDAAIRLGMWAIVWNLELLVGLV
jgi:hypothetical protein